MAELLPADIDAGCGKTEMLLTMRKSEAKICPKISACYYTKFTRMAVFGFSVAEAIFFLTFRCYNALRR